MENSSPLRAMLVVLLGAAMYFGLLWLLYSTAPYTSVPAWCRQLLTPLPAATMLWFALINVGGAVLAAIPVAIGVLLVASAQRHFLGLAIGVVTAIYIAGGGLVAYGSPSSLTAFITDVIQFFAVGLAVLAVVALIPKRLEPFLVSRFR